MPTVYFVTLDDETVAVDGDIGDIVMELARAEGIEAPLAPSTVHRLLSREGLLDKRPGEPTPADRRRFAFRDAGELWMSDVKHGPKVSDGRR